VAFEQRPRSSTLMLLDRAVPPHQVLSNPEFAPVVGFAWLGGGSDGSWRGAFGIAQRQIPARVTGEGELGGRFPSELRVGSGIVVQQGSRTPTGPFFARFFIDFIPGLVAEFGFMEGSRRLMMSLSAALLMDRKRIDGWRFQHGCSIEQHALTLNL